VRRDKLLYWLKCTVAVAKKDMKIYYFKGPVMILGVLVPLFMLLAFYMGRSMPPHVVAISLMSVVVFFTATAVTPVIAPWETATKTLERLVASPAPLLSILLGDAVSSFIFALAASSVAAVACVLMGVVVNPVILALATVLAAFCFSILGVIIASPPSSMPQTVMMLSTLIKFPLLFVSGVFMPLEQMPWWARPIAMLSPLTYYADLVRYTTLGVSYNPPITNLAALAAFTVIFLFVAVKAHRRSLIKRLQ